MQPYFQDESVTIYHGDCVEVLRGIDSAIDHFITDPPYGKEIYNKAKGLRRQEMSQEEQSRRGHSMMRLANDEIGAIDEMIRPVSDEIGRLVTRWAIVFSDLESCHLWRFGLEAARMRYVRTGAWIKPDAMPQMSGDRPSVGFEPCTIAHALGSMRWNGGGHPAVWTHNTCKGTDRPDHPCPKPLSLMKELIHLFTDAGEIVCDPFMGSGTTLRAAKDLDRRAIGIDSNEMFCEIAARRMSQGTLGFNAPERNAEIRLRGSQDVLSGLT